MTDIVAITYWTLFWPDVALLAGILVVGILAWLILRRGNQ